VLDEDRSHGRMVVRRVRQSTHSYNLVSTTMCEAVWRAGQPDPPFEPRTFAFSSSGVFARECSNFAIRSLFKRFGVVELWRILSGKGAQPIEIWEKLIKLSPVFCDNLRPYVAIASPADFG
jgi:hypothetical protein